MPAALDGDNSDVLGKCLVFQALSAEDRRRLAARAHRKSYESGDLVFGFGSPGQSMMAILSGRVRITRPTVPGKEVILGELGAGQVLGEIALLDGRPRSADAVAVTRSDLLVLERRELLPFLRQHADTCLSLLELVCGKLRQSDERMSDIGFSGISVRLAKMLLLHASVSGATAKLSLSQSDLAEMVGGTRETVNRQLRAWAAESVVEMRRGWILVKRPEILRAIADQG